MDRRKEQLGQISSSQISSTEDQIHSLLPSISPSEIQTKIALSPTVSRVSYRACFLANSLFLPSAFAWIGSKLLHAGYLEPFTQVDLQLAPFSTFLCSIAAVGQMLQIKCRQVPFAFPSLFAFGRYLPHLSLLTLIRMEYSFYFSRMLFENSDLFFLSWWSHVAPLFAATLDRLDGIAIAQLGSPSRGPPSGHRQTHERYCCHKGIP